MGRVSGFDGSIRSDYIILIYGVLSIVDVWSSAKYGARRSVLTDGLSVGFIWRHCCIRLLNGPTIVFLKLYLPRHTKAVNSLIFCALNGYVPSER